MLPRTRELGTIFNNDINNILCAMDADHPALEDYRRALEAILDARPGVFAQNVGMPEAAVQKQMLSVLGDPEAIRQCRKQPAVCPQ